jgi:hypothetical protein
MIITVSFTELEGVRGVTMAGRPPAAGNCLQCDGERRGSKPSVSDERGTVFLKRLKK